MNSGSSLFDTIHLYVFLFNSLLMQLSFGMKFDKSVNIAASMYAIFAQILWSF